MNMDRRLWIFPALALLLAGACSKKTGGSLKLAKDTDSVAYVIGMNVGLNLQRMDSTINVEAVCEGIRDVFREKTRLSGEEARTFYLGYVKSNRSYARTGSGVTYTVTAVGDQERIPATDRDSVALRCVIRTADGRQLYSSYERGDTLRDALGSLRRGVRESVKLIGRGGRIEAWIPAAAAYGAEGDKTLGIGPNATLFYEIELVGVDKYAEWSRRNKLRR